MKQLLPPANATFSASVGTITFATTVPLTIAHILHVTNVTRGVIYFQPQAGTSYSGTYASPVLTLNASTSGHADADKLEIFYDDGLTTTGVTGTFWQATQPVSGTVTATTGGLTDTQLRATPVPVSGTVTATTGGLTDTQLRASAVPISVASLPSQNVTNTGTFAVQSASTLSAETTKVIGTVNVAAGQTIATTNTGTFAVQAAATLAAETTKVIGTVNVASSQTIAVTNAGTFAVQVLTACGGANTANGQVSISSAATIITSRALRRYCIIRNLDASVSGYVGIATVTTANGMLVKAGESIRIDSQALIQGIAASGTISFAYIEFYD